MIHRKENGQLKAKAGLGIIDNILSTLSNHPISNRAVATEFGKVSADLSAKANISDLIKSSDFVVEGYSVTQESYYTATKDGYYPICALGLYTGGGRNDIQLDVWQPSYGSVKFRVQSSYGNPHVQVLWLKLAE